LERNVLSHCLLVQLIYVFAHFHPNTMEGKSVLRQQVTGLKYL